MFMGGHLAGDLVWSTLALVAIVGAKTVGTLVFDVLGLLCGLYLAWIGWTALRAKPRGTDIGRTRPTLQFRTKLLEDRLGRLRVDLHIAVRQIADPAADAQS